MPLRFMGEFMLTAVNYPLTKEKKSFILDVGATGVRLREKQDFRKENIPDLPGIIWVK